MRDADRLMQQAIADGVFPGAVLLVSKTGTTALSESYGYIDGTGRLPVTPGTVFDLASLTKPLATTPAVMKLVGEKKIGLSDSLASILPHFSGTDKASITVRHLLCHTSGLPDYRPLYLKLGGAVPERRTDLCRRYLVETPLIHPIGKETVYSDLGFMILQWVVEAVSGRHLDRLTAEEIYRPMGISDLFYVNRRFPRPDRRYAATEKCPWRGRLLQGEVHDENAWILEGVAGHAGLFGTAGAVNHLLWRLIEVYKGGSPEDLFLNQALVRDFFSRQPGTERVLGFDTPSQTGASCGRHFSGHTVGHLGFTGTSFWVDLERTVVVVLLTNRVHPTRENVRIRAFRPQLHDAVMAAMVGTAGSG